MKGRLIGALTLSSITIGIMVWLVIRGVTDSFAYADVYHVAGISAVFWISSISLFILGIVILAMNKGEVRGIGISVGVLSILTVFLWPIAIAVAIVSLIGVLKL